MEAWLRQVQVWSTEMCSHPRITPLFICTLSIKQGHIQLASMLAGFEANQHLPKHTNPNFFCLMRAINTEIANMLC